MWHTTFKMAEILGRHVLAHMHNGYCKQTSRVEDMCNISYLVFSSHAQWLCYSNSCKSFPFSLAGPGAGPGLVLQGPLSKRFLRVSLTRFRRDGSSLPRVALAKKKKLYFIQICFIYAIGSKMSTK